MAHHISSQLLASTVRIAVIGAGGTGSQVINGLAQMHHALVALGHPGGLNVTVYDADTVSDSNVGRQAFFPSDVGLAKAVVLVNRVNMAMGLDWTAVPKHYDGGMLNAQIVIGCVDTRAARLCIKKGLRSEVYYLDFGNAQKTGQCVMGFTPHKHDAYAKRILPHAFDLFPEMVDAAEDALDDGPSCSMAEALSRQSLFVNRTMANYGLNILWELFRAGQISYHGGFVNLETGRSSPIAVDPEVWSRFGFHIEGEKKAA